MAKNLVGPLMPRAGEVDVSKLGGVSHGEGV